MAGSAIGGIAGGILGGGAPDAPNIQVWQPQNTDAADTNWWDLSNQNIANNPYKDYANQFQEVYGQQYNNPYAAGAQNGANTAASQYGNMGNMAQQSATQLNGAAMSMLPYAQQIMQTAMDPQQALQGRMQQQLQDQTRVSQGARGITNSPYGAGLENQAMSNFNIDWQNQQLARQTQGLDSANKAITGATANAASANNLGMAGAGATQQAGLLPYQTSQGIAGDKYNALTNVINSRLGTNQLNSANMAALMQYMGLGASQSNEQAKWDQQNYMNQLQQAGTSGGGLGSIINGAASFMGAPTGMNGIMSGMSGSLPWLSNGSNMMNMLGMFAL